LNMRHGDPSLIYAFDALALPIVLGQNHAQSL
jgi:hypothetical protein